MPKVLIAAMWVTMVWVVAVVVFFVFAVQHRQDVLDGVRVGGAGVVRRGVSLLPPLGGRDDAAVRVRVAVRVEHDHRVFYFQYLEYNIWAAFFVGVPVQIALILGAKLHRAGVHWLRR